MSNKKSNVTKKILSSKNLGKQGTRKAFPLENLKEEERNLLPLDDIEKRKVLSQRRTENLQKIGEKNLQSFFLALNEQYGWSFGKTEQEKFEQSPEEFFGSQDRFGEKIPLEEMGWKYKGIIVEEDNIHEALYGRLIEQEQSTEDVYKKYMDVEEYQAKYDSGELSPDYVENPMIYYNFDDNAIYSIVYSFQNKTFSLEVKYPPWLENLMIQAMKEKYKSIKERIEGKEQVVIGEKPEIVSGGFADFKTYKKFLRSQIEKGLIIEMEHTNNPVIALEIVLDHLAEYENYYDRLEEAEGKMKKDKTSKAKEIQLMDKKLEQWKRESIHEFTKEWESY